ncbi:MAG: nucleotidyl transferase AbiEii/AbiGii toxin family protein [Actinobacteria bacterium]|nr:nucleotidyl transferase AbiEii/AbiGii toxin family protein [Actinomycetota bacterium]
MKIDLINRSQLSIVNKSNYRYPLAEAEKDYFLAVVLKILFTSPLAEKLVFKGGTALHHLYLDQLRFSEDLDFGTIDEISINDIEEVIAQTEFLEIKKVSKSDFSLKINRLKFTGPLGQPNSLKIDIDL